MEYIIKVVRGLMFLKEEGTFKVLGVPEADRIARANGLHYAENFVRDYDGKTLKLDEYLKVKNEQP